MSKNAKTTLSIIGILIVVVAIGLAAVMAFKSRGGKTITMADNNLTVKYKAGELFSLDLSKEYDWFVNINDKSIVSEVQVNRQYKAEKAGKTVLTATGQPKCQKNRPPCEEASTLFAVKIEVEK